MQLFQNKEDFSQFLSAFRQSTWNLKDFQKKVEPHTWFLTEIIDWKKRSYLNTQRAPRQNS